MSTNPCLYVERHVLKYAQANFLMFLNIFVRSNFSSVCSSHDLCVHPHTHSIVHHSQSHNPSSSWLRLLSSIHLLFKQYSFQLACFYLSKNAFISPACTWTVIALSIQLLVNKGFFHMK